jgi:hypothetical protein
VILAVSKFGLCLLTRGSRNLLGCRFSPTRRALAGSAAEKWVMRADARTFQKEVGAAPIAAGQQGF